MDYTRVGCLAVVDAGCLQGSSLDIVRNALTFKLSGGFGMTVASASSSFCLLNVSPRGRHVLPYFFAYRLWGPARVERLPPVGHAWPGGRITCRIQLSPAHHQPEAFASLWKALSTQRTALIQLPCGSGKTMLALYTAYQFSRKTLILVPNNTLAEQWRDRIEQYLPGATIGRLQGDVCDVEDKDVVIAMLQSVCTQRYDRCIADTFGFCILDECHRMGAPTFSKAIPWIGGIRYVLGMSATPQRVDGLHQVFFNYLGPLVYQADASVNVHGRRTQVVRALFTQGEQKEFWLGRDRLFRPKMMNALAEDAQRNFFLAAWLRYLVLEKGRTVLVLSHRTSQLRYLQGVLHELPCTRYWGKLKPHERAQALDARCILATYSLASEGLDLQHLNTLVFATPTSNVVQAVGRIMRKELAKVPLIVDIVDPFSIYAGQAAVRLRLYKKNGWPVDELAPQTLCC